MPSDPSTPGLASAVIIDRRILNTFFEEIGSDAEALAEVLQAYLADGARLVQKLDRAIGSADLRAAAATAHTLKGTSSSIGATGLAAHCAQLDRSTGGISLTDARVLQAEIAAEFSRVQALLALPAEAVASVEIEALFRRIA